MAGALSCIIFLFPAAIARADEAKMPERQPLPARPGDFALKVEPGVALALTDPQSQIFKGGAGQTVKALWSANRYLDIGPSATFLALPTEASSKDLGAAWAFGGGLRFKRPHDARDDDKFYAMSPWVDADILYVRTGALDRPGFAVAVGLSSPIGESRTFWVGPFVRYLQIMQADRVGFDNHDAKILSLGISLEVGSGVEREREREREVLVANEVRSLNKETFYCPDRDQDGAPDSVDHCPEVAGPIDNWGCPAYQKIIIKQDKLELKEKIQFGWDQAILQDDSLPVLDEVVLALKEHKDFRVQVEGHASSDGGDDHNQTLSEKRAEAVLDYLVAHGIAKERLVSRGFASSEPADTNKTNAGRENNRRVEFVVNFIILDDRSK
jgi:outer membrane protein OmpA-like peptidoglycan-associated protein